MLEPYRSDPAPRREFLRRKVRRKAPQGERGAAGNQHSWKIFQFFSWLWRSWRSPPPPAASPAAAATGAGAHARGSPGAARLRAAAAEAAGAAAQGARALRGARAARARTRAAAAAAVRGACARARATSSAIRGVGARACTGGRLPPGRTALRRTSVLARRRRIRIRRAAAVGGVVLHV